MHTLRLVGAFAFSVALVYVVAQALVAYLVSENQREARRRYESDLQARDRRSHFRLIASDRVTRITTSSEHGPGHPPKRGHAQRPAR